MNVLWKLAETKLISKQKSKQLSIVLHLHSTSVLYSADVQYRYSRDTVEILYCICTVQADVQWHLVVVLLSVGASRAAWSLNHYAKIKKVNALMQHFSTKALFFLLQALFTQVLFSMPNNILTQHPHSAGCTRANSAFSVSPKDASTCRL